MRVIVSTGNQPLCHRPFKICRNVCNLGSIKNSKSICLSFEQYQNQYETRAKLAIFGEKGFQAYFYIQHQVADVLFKT